MTYIELNAVLYYADYLSLQHESHPATDNCKYFFIHGFPINSAYIVDMEPEYSLDNQYIIQAFQEFQIIKDKYDDEAAMSFIDDICSIKACGSVDAERMLKCIHQFSTKHERRQAFNTYNNWKKQQSYSHIIFDENGDPQQVPCTRFVKHAEKSLARRKLYKSYEFDDSSTQECN